MARLGGVRDERLEALGFIGQLLDRVWMPAVVKPRIEDILGDRYGKRRRRVV